MNSALALANYFIKTAIDKGLANRDFPPSKIHGLVYLAHGWLLGSAGAPIVRGAIMADKDGIFLPELKEAGCWGTKNVTQPVCLVEMDEKRGLMVEHTPQIAPGNPTASALDWVWKTYGTLSSFKIGEHIKESGSPWERVWHDPARKGDEPRPVANPAIRAWFRGLTSKREEQSQTSRLNKTQQLELHPKVDEPIEWLSQFAPKRLK